MDDWRDTAHAIASALDWHYQRAAGRAVGYRLAYKLARAWCHENGYPTLTAAEASDVAEEIMCNELEAPHLD